MNRTGNKKPAEAGLMSHMVGRQVAPLATVPKALSRVAYRCLGNLLMARPFVLFCAAILSEWSALCFAGPKPSSIF